MLLSDLTADTWTPVARRVLGPHGEDIWHWLLSPYDHAALNLARENGHVITAQKRGDDGQFRLLAKLVRRQQPHAAPISFETMGKGMFEQ